MTQFPPTHVHGYPFFFTSSSTFMESACFFSYTLNDKELEDII